MTPLRDKAVWGARYRATVAALERVQVRELAGMTDLEAMRRIRLLRTVGKPWRARRDWSGLVEQQALFHRQKKQ